MPQLLHQHPTLRAPGERSGAPILSALALVTAAAVAVTQGTAFGFGYDPILGAPLLRLSGGSATALRTLWPLWLALPIGLYLVPATRRLVSAAVLASTVLLSLGHGPIYAPWDYLDWLVAVRHEPALRAVAMRPLAWASGALLAVLVLAAARWRLPSAGHVHGSGRFATAAEAQRFGLLGREGIVLGQLAPTWWGRRRVLRHGGTEHVLFIGHTRAGKTSGCAIPSVLGWRDHLVVFDPKGGEIFQATAGAKRAEGHCVLRFAPGSEGGARWNPLWEIEPGPGEVAQMQRLALNLISSPTGPGGDPHWVQSARQVFVALALHVLYGERVKSIGRCRELLMGTAGEDPRAPFRVMVDAVHDGDGDGDGERGWRDPRSALASPTHPEVRRIASALLKTPLRELGSILSTLNKYLEPWADPRVDASTEVSDFTLRALRGEEPTAIYVTTARSDVERLAPLLRVFFTSAAATLSGEEAYVDWAARASRERRTLVVLDEFASLGHMPFFAQMLSVLAGYGVTLLVLIQDYAQLTSTYGRDEPISGGCPYLVATSSSRPETMAYLSRLTGETTVEWRKESVSGGRLLPGRRSASMAEARRPLLTEGEIRTLPEEAQLVFAPGLHPILARKALYFEERRLRALAAIAPPRGGELPSDPFNPWRFAPVGEGNLDLGREKPPGAATTSLKAAHGRAAGDRDDLQERSPQR